MEWSELILGVVGAILLAVAAPLGKILASLLKGALNNIKHQALQQAAWVAVRYAEKTFSGSGRGAEKLDYVYGRLTKKFPWASDVKLKEFIESTVDSMRSELGNVAGSPTAQ